jgi:hypothetical protein
MKKTFIFMSIVLLTFSFIFIGCSDPDDTPDTTDITTTDPALNGTWVNEYGYKVILNNGAYEFRDYNNQPYEMGTYKTDGDKFIITPTRLYAEGEWYSKEAIKALLIADGVTLSEEVLAEIDEAFSPYTRTYKLEGDTLTTTRTYENKEGETITDTEVFTKQ